MVAGLPKRKIAGATKRIVKATDNTLRKQDKAYSKRAKASGLRLPKIKRKR